MLGQFFAGLVAILFAAAVLPLILGEENQERVLPLIRLAVLIWMIRSASGIAG
ncbi:hypothetical protein ACFFIY_10755 [Bhargavaea ullalensis]|uniref:Uncharacterized protein n=1 Tax=Bhargavaea ullalensis TaxID=1265685 RepID=A0ABV2G9P3_9BACL